MQKGSLVDFPFFCIGALCRSFAVAAIFSVKLLLLSKFLLRIPEGNLGRTHFIEKNKICVYVGYKMLRF